MASVELAPEISDDFDRIFEHLAEFDLEHAVARISAIVEALNVLETNPEIGRPAARQMRELVIGRGSRGYIALYRYLPELDTVFVLAIRSRREAGYRRG
jgi:plasmid stabilization system protein ParE